MAFFNHFSLLFSEKCLETHTVYAFIHTYKIHTRAKPYSTHTHKHTDPNAAGKMVVKFVVYGKYEIDTDYI